MPPPDRRLLRPNFIDEALLWLSQGRPPMTMTSPSPPPPGSAQRGSYMDEDWQHYWQIEWLVNHWERPGWTPGRRSHHWMLTFPEAPTLRDLAAQCQARLSDLPTLDLVPLQTLHVTLQRVGFNDEIDRVEVADMICRARAHRANLRPVDLTIGPLAGSSGAVRFSVGPHEAVRKIKEAVGTAIAETISGDGAGDDDDDGFVPHVSIAYNNMLIPAGPVIHRVAELRRLGSVEVIVSAVDLVELRRECRSYAWEIVDRVELGG